MGPKGGRTIVPTDNPIIAESRARIRERVRLSRQRKKAEQAEIEARAQQFVIENAVEEELNPDTNLDDDPAPTGTLRKLKLFSLPDIDNPRLDPDLAAAEHYHPMVNDPAGYEESSEAITDLFDHEDVQAEQEHLGQYGEEPQSHATQQQSSTDVDQQLGRHFQVSPGVSPTVLENSSRGEAFHLGAHTILENSRHQAPIASVPIPALEDDSSHETDQQDEAQEEIAQTNDDLLYTVDKLYAQLVDGFHGCSLADHASKHQDHIAGEQEHNGLDALLYVGMPFPSVLDRERMLTPEDVRTIPKPDRLAWLATFNGVRYDDGQRKPPMKLCLHVDDRPATGSATAYDIDSFMGFASSLAVARRGLSYQPISLPSQNIQTDLHVDVEQVQYGDDDEILRIKRSPLKKIPHVMFGRLAGSDGVKLHLVFPHLTFSQDKFFALTNQQTQRLNDEIILPALRRNYPEHYLQHLHLDHKHAKGITRASQREARMVSGMGYDTQKLVSYHLNPTRLEQLWTDIKRIVSDTPGLWDFRDMMLFFDAKGTKLQFKTLGRNETLLNAMQAFNGYLHEIININHVNTDTFYLDIGKEICPTELTDTAAVEPLAKVLLWRRCCLESYLQWTYDGEPPKGAGQNWFVQNMLRDAVGLTSLTPRSSRLRAGGLLYSQFYASVKETVDAMKVYPFQNSGLEELAFDASLYDGITGIIGGKPRSLKILEDAYCDTKLRAHHSLQIAQGTSFGLREEHRIRWQTYMALLSRLEPVPGTDDQLQGSSPPYAWSISSPAYFTFLGRAVDNFTSAFEYIRAGGGGLVTWEQSKVMIMLIRYLRYILSSGTVSRESSLWWDKREVKNSTPIYGLGLARSLKMYGYCWLANRIDWDGLQFRQSVRDHTLFGDRILRGTQIRRRNRVENFMDRTKRMDLALTTLWRENYSFPSVIGQRLLYFMIHLCLEQFRVDTLIAIRKFIIGVEEDTLQTGQIPFSKSGLELILGTELHLVRGNRTKYKDPYHTAQYLLCVNDDLSRSSWEKRAFRQLIRRLHQGLERIWGEAQYDKVEKLLVHELLTYHWILPNSTSQEFVTRDSKGRLMWYSIVPSDGSTPHRNPKPRQVPERRQTRQMARLQVSTDDSALPEKALPEKALPEKQAAREQHKALWMWAGSTARSGNPPNVPAYLNWNSDQWNVYLNEVNHQVVDSDRRLHLTANHTREGNSSTQEEMDSEEE